jgi:hypothetical protein
MGPLAAPSMFNRGCLFIAISQSFTHGQPRFPGPASGNSAACFAFSRPPLELPPLDLSQCRPPALAPELENGQEQKMCSCGYAMQEFEQTAQAAQRWLARFGIPHETG